MVTRRNPDQAVEGELNAAQSIGIDEAVAAFTRNPAAHFQEATAAIHRTQVLKTYLEGDLVYAAGEQQDTVAGSGLVVTQN